MYIDLITQAVLNIENERLVPEGYQPSKEEILKHLRPSVSPSEGNFILADEINYLNVTAHSDIQLMAPIKEN